MDCHWGSAHCLSEDLVQWLLFWGNVALIMRDVRSLSIAEEVALMFAKANVSSIWSRQLVCNQGLIDISKSPLRSLNYMMRRQLKWTRNYVRMKVAGSAEAQPEETDHRQSSK